MAPDINYLKLLQNILNPSRCLVIHPDRPALPYLEPATNRKTAVCWAAAGKTVCAPLKGLLQWSFRSVMSKLSKLLLTAFPSKSAVRLRERWSHGQICVQSVKETTMKQPGWGCCTLRNSDNSTLSTKASAVCPKLWCLPRRWQCWSTALSLALPLSLILCLLYTCSSKAHSA